MSNRWIAALLLLAGCAGTAEEIPEQPEVETEAEAPGGSEILFAGHVRVDGIDDHAGEPAPAALDVEPAERLSFAASAVAPPWNSAAGRALVAPLLADDAPAAPRFLPAGDEPCTTAEFMVGRENLRLPDGTRLQAPATVFASATDARSYLATVRAHMPMILPDGHPGVRLGHGWMYNGGGSHRGQDYSRSDVESGDDPTFAVRAVADGRVLVVYWGGAGNGVAIEHTAPDGFRFLSVYYHLRNGKDHDLAKALALDCSQSGDSRCPKYKLFAQRYPNHVSWGTNAHKLMVKLGDTVVAGQQLGWAGNTGPGGAGNGLNDDGSPKSPRGNVHLHTYWGAQHPTEPNTFIHIDPYGVYNKENTGCYDLLEDTLFARVVAPFYENFHALPLEVLSTYFSYYAQMGMSPRTLSVHRDGFDVRATGSFQRGIPGSWSTRLYMTEATFQQRFDENFAAGRIPRETTVIPDGWGSSPRYSVTFRPRLPGEGFDHRGRMTSSVWQQKWSALVEGQRWRVADYFGYSVGGDDYRAALFSSTEGRPFYLWTNQTYSGLKSRIQAGFEDGLAPVSVTVAELDDATRYNVILMPRAGCWHWYVGLSKDSYQATWSSMAARGYRLEKVQGYDGSDKYAAVFTLASGATPAVCP